MKILQTKTVPGLWGTYTYPLKPGTPISKTGAVANTSDAIGIVMETIYQAPDTKTDMLPILIGGYVEACELGYELADAAVQAMKGITIYDANGSGMSNALPAVTADDNGKVLGVAEGAWTKVAGGADVMVVPVAGDLSGETPEYNTDISIDDVATACADGKGVMYVLNIDAGEALFSLHSVSVYMVRTEGSASAVIKMPESGEFPTTYYHTADGFSDQAPSVGG